MLATAMSDNRSSTSLKALLQDTNDILIIDGALATQLEAEGADLKDPLWSCKTLLEQPDLIQKVHLAYFQAGADIAITASYQASPKGLQEQRGTSLEESKALIAKSVRLAQAAREEYLSDPTVDKRPLFIAGSVGPYGAYLADGSEYRGDYYLSEEDFKSFHRPRIDALIEAGADLLAIETMPDRWEVEAIMHLLEEEFPTAQAWISFTLIDGSAMSDKTPLSEMTEVLTACKQVVAVGVNCVPPHLVSQALQILEQGTAKPVLCYPNSGEAWDGEAKVWKGGEDSGATNWEQLVAEWRKCGAKMVGGCCRTGPKDVQAIKDACRNG